MKQKSLKKVPLLQILMNVSVTLLPNNLAQYVLSTSPNFF